jgi:hypothetical protein
VGEILKEEDLKDQEHIPFFYKWHNSSDLIKRQESRRIEDSGFFAKYSVL